MLLRTVLQAEKTISTTELVCCYKGGTSRTNSRDASFWTHAGHKLPFRYQARSVLINAVSAANIQTPACGFRGRARRFPCSRGAFAANGRRPCSRSALRFEEPAQDGSRPCDPDSALCAPWGSAADVRADRKRGGRRKFRSIRLRGRWFSRGCRDGDCCARTRGSRGPKGHFGSGIIGAGRSTRSIPKQARFIAPSRPAASSPGSRGSTESSGTAPGKVARAM